MAILTIFLIIIINYYIFAQNNLILTKIKPKMKKFFFKSLVLIITTVIFISCGSSEGDDDPSNQVTSITINSNANSIELGSSFTFIVRDNNNTNITNESTIYVNGAAIAGSTYTPTAGGTYTVNAKYEGITSANISVTVSLAPVNASVDKEEILLGDSVTFSATGSGGVDITSSAIFYIDGIAITGNTFTPSSRATYMMTASYNGVTSSEVPVYVGYVQKVLVEDYTGTWCGYCPRLAYNLEDAETQSDDVFGVAVHNGDAMTYEFEAQLRAQFGINSFPSGRINRTVIWSEMVGQILNLRGINRDLGLGITTSLSGTTISVDVKVAYNNEMNNNKLVIYLLEDGLVYSQVNYMNNDSSSPWYQAGNPIVGFTHNNVLRKAFTDVFGDTIPNAVAGDEYTGTYTLAVPASVQDTSKLEIVAFVVDNTNTAINAQRVSLGMSQDYQ